MINKNKKFIMGQFFDIAEEVDGLLRPFCDEFDEYCRLDDALAAGKQACRADDAEALDEDKLTDEFIKTTGVYKLVEQKKEKLLNQLADGKNNPFYKLNARLDNFYKCVTAELHNQLLRDAFINTQNLGNLFDGRLELDDGINKQINCMLEHAKLEVPFDIFRQVFLDKLDIKKYLEKVLGAQLNDGFVNILKIGLGCHNINWVPDGVKGGIRKTHTGLITGYSVYEGNAQTNNYVCTITDKIKVTKAEKFTVRDGNECYEGTFYDLYLDGGGFNKLLDLHELRYLAPHYAKGRGEINEHGRKVTYSALDILRRTLGRTKLNDAYQQFRDLYIAYAYLKQAGAL